MGAIEVIPAVATEAAACLALLPELRPFVPELLIARCNGAFAGAAGLVWRSWAKPGGFPLSVQVLPRWRRCGVGRALVDAALEMARGEARGVWSLGAIPEHGFTAEFLRACGFAAARRQRHFIAGVDSLLAFVGPLAARMRAAGRMPASARIESLAEASLDEVGWLMATEFGGGPLRALHQLRRRGAGRRRERSIVALDGDALAGVLLCQIRDEVGMVDAWVAAPEWRGGWVSLALLEAILLRGKADGVEDFRFYCDDTAQNTLKLARRCAATEVATDALFYQAAATS